jgi:hypothetical protein
LFPKLEAPYSGYLTWRGVVPEKRLSEETINFLHDNCIRYRTDGSYIVVYIPQFLFLSQENREHKLIGTRYIIPGENGNKAPGQRHVNLVWYYNCAQDWTEYTMAMTDIDGLQHQRTVPFGKVRPEVWGNRKLTVTQILLHQ